MEQRGSVSTPAEGSPDPAAFDIKHHHGAVSVRSLQDSIDWYRRTLDFELESTVELRHVPALVATLRRGKLRIELFEVAGAKAASEDRRTPDLDLKTLGTKHFAFAVRDIEAAADTLRQRGVDIVFVKKMPFASFAFIRDNDGNLIELIQQPELWEP